MDVKWPKKNSLESRYSSSPMAARPCSSAITVIGLGFYYKGTGLSFIFFLFFISLLVFNS